MGMVSNDYELVRMKQISKHQLIKEANLFKIFSLSGVSPSKAQSGAKHCKDHTLGQIWFKPWCNHSHYFLSKVNSFKDHTSQGKQVAKSPQEEQEHSYHALITSLRSLNQLQAIKAYQAKKLRFSQEQTHNLSTTDQTWGTKSINVYLPIIALLKYRVSGSQNLSPKPKSNPYWQLPKIKVHFADIFINSNPINIGTQKVSPSKRGINPKTTHNPLALPHALHTINMHNFPSKSGSCISKGSLTKIRNFH